jgi:hypothetical protein
MIVRRAVVFGERHFGNGEIRNGVYTDFWNMVPGSGLSVGPGYRQWYARDHVFVDTSAAMSWRRYKTAQARIEFPRLVKSRLTLGSQIRWQDFTHVAFFGAGPGTLEEDRGEFQIKSHNLVGYATVRPTRWLGLGAEIGWLSPSIEAREGLLEGALIRDVLSGSRLFAPDGEPAFVHTELAVTADTRDFPGHPTRGGLVRLARVGYSDRDGGAFTFAQYEAEAAGFVPVAGGRVVLAGRGLLVAADTAQGHSVPFYLLPSLGGQNSLRGYSDYRFHDRNLLLMNVEARFALMRHIDLAAFLDAGNVAPRFGGLDLSKRSIGIGARLHSKRQTYGRVDLARSAEGWRLLLSFNEPLNLSRLLRHTAAVPFVP